MAIEDVDRVVFVQAHHKWEWEVVTKAAVGYSEASTDVLLRELFACLFSPMGHNYFVDAVTIKREFYRKWPCLLRVKIDSIRMPKDVFFEDRQQIAKFLAVGFVWIWIAPQLQKCVIAELR